MTLKSKYEILSKMAYLSFEKLYVEVTHNIYIDLFELEVANLCYLQNNFENSQESYVVHIKHHKILFFHY
jgi:hypothetical protein